MLLYVMLYVMSTTSNLERRCDQRDTSRLPAVASRPGGRREPKRGVEGNGLDPRDAVSAAVHGACHPVHYDRSTCA